MHLHGQIWGLLVCECSLFVTNFGHCCLLSVRGGLSFASFFVPMFFLDVMMPCRVVFGFGSWMGRFVLTTVESWLCCTFTVNKNTKFECVSTVIVLVNDQSLTKRPCISARHTSDDNNGKRVVRSSRQVVTCRHL
jgi:hypothetical protein